MKEEWIKIPIAVAAIGLLLLAMSFLQMLTVTKEKNPSEEKKPMQKDSINGYGLEESMGLSEKKLLETDSWVCYEDRVYYHFSYQSESLEHIFITCRTMAEMSDMLERIYLVPVVPRALFEADSQADVNLYQEFIEKINAKLPQKASLVDCRSILQEHVGEYLFFRTEDAWTARGAGYASEEIARAMGVEAIPMEAYEEYMYSYFYGSAFYDILRHTEYEAFTNGMPKDPLFYYLLPNAHNRAWITAEDEDKKKLEYCAPLVMPSAQNLSAFVSNDYRRAVATGEGKDGDILLLCDEAGKVLAPFLANYCKKLHIINITEDRTFYQDFKQLLQKNQIDTIVYSQNARNMGEESYSRAILPFMQEEGRKK